MSERDIERIVDHTKHKTFTPRTRSRSFAIPARRTTTGPVETHRGRRRRRPHLAHITPASLSCSRSATYTALSDMSSQCAWGLTSDESVNQSISQSVICLISRPAWKTAKRFEKLRLTNRHLIRPRLGSGPHASRLLRPRIIIHSFSQLFHGPAPRSPLRRLSSITRT